MERHKFVFTVFADNRQLFGAVSSIPHILQIPFTTVFGPVTMPFTTVFRPVTFSPLLGT
jgi:hypothetical protein